MGPTILNADEVAAQLSQSIVTLAKLTGFSERTVTLAECGAILKACVGKTKVAAPGEIRSRVRTKVFRHVGVTSGQQSVTINTGARGTYGRVWSYVKNPANPRPASRRDWLLVGQLSDDGQRFTPAKYRVRRWSDVIDLTQEVARELKKAVPPALASAGLARQSWVQIADDLGIILEDIPGGSVSAAAIAKARKAIASNGRTYTNGIGTMAYEENKSFLAKLVNQLPYNTRAKLDLTLASVMAGRARYFAENVNRQVLASHAATVRAYPWMKLLGAG
ncbi:MAG TPA: hypothetical protein VEA63_16325 [Opitutus sp.]|nr:hypothetical protein [Opitutus sp.]